MSFIRLAAAAQLFLLLGSGCSFDHVSDRTGPAYDFDADRIGTGQPVFTPSNDHRYWNGMPMDARTK